jgi:hypothetical protein
MAMNTLRAVLFVTSLSTLLGCRINPCGDREGTLPESLRPAGAALPGAKVCDARGEEATLMYWGGREQLHATAARALASMAADGWTQLPPNPYVHQDRDAPVYGFRRGADELSLRFHLTSTPRFGAKFWADSITIYAQHEAAQPTRFRSHP